MFHDSRSWIIAEFKWDFLLYRSMPDASDENRYDEEQRYLVIQVRQGMRVVG